MKTPIWYKLNPKVTPEHLGLIPSFLDEEDPRGAGEQFDEAYAHGGGWRPMGGWRLNLSDDISLTYGDDPPLKPLAFTKLREERIFVYPNAWVVVLRPDRSFEVSRMD